MIGDTGEHVGEPGLRVNVVELGGSDRGVNGGRPFAAAIRPANGQTRPPSATPREVRSAALLLRQMRPSSIKRVKASQRVYRTSARRTTSLTPRPWLGQCLGVDLNPPD